MIIHPDRWSLDLLKCLKPRTTGVILATFTVYFLLYKDQRFKCAAVGVYILHTVGMGAHSVGISLMFSVMSSTLKSMVSRFFNYTRLIAICSC